MFERITFDPAIQGGRACIRGMRISVSVIVRQMAHGASNEEILGDYPELEPADLTAALGYVLWLARGPRRGDSDPPATRDEELAKEAPELIEAFELQALRADIEWGLYGRD